MNDEDRGASKKKFAERLADQIVGRARPTAARYTTPRESEAEENAVEILGVGRPR